MCVKKIEKREFFTRSAVVVAEELLGKIIFRKIEGKSEPIKIRITATEAYGPWPSDTACYPPYNNQGRALHANVICEEGGVCYTRDISKKGKDRGYDKLMIVTGERGSPQNVLISGAISSDGLTIFDGSSKVVAALEINQTDDVNGICLIDDMIWIADDGTKPKNILAKKRKLGKYHDGEVSEEDFNKPWRFYMD